MTKHTLLPALLAKRAALEQYRGSSLPVTVVAVPDRHGGAALNMARLNKTELTKQIKKDKASGILR
jgi:hypothetical protein